MSVLSAEEIYKEDDQWIEVLYAGRFNPRAPVFDIRDIAHNLSHNARFAGAGRRRYNVADHSLMVSYLMERYGLGDPLEGLLHDAPEAYLPDLAAPLKAMLPDYRALDNRLDEAVRRQFGLPLKKTPGCKEADWLALFIEAYELLPGKGANFADPCKLRDKALAIRREWPLKRRWFLNDRRAEKAFLRRFWELWARR